MAKKYTTGIIITGDGRGGIKAIKATEESLGKYQKTTKKSAKSTRDLSDSVKSAASKFGGLATITAGAVTAGAAYIAYNASVIKQQQMLADAIGVSASSMSSLAYAFRDTEISGEKLGDILKDTSEKIGDYFSTGGGEAGDVLERLNLDINEMIDLSADQQLLKIADALQDVNSQSEKIFLMESLASDAALLLPLLEDGASGLRAAQQEAVALGVSLSDIDSKKIAMASSDIGRLGQGFVGAGNLITSEFAPVFGAVSGAIVDTIVETNGLKTATAEMSESVLEGLSFILDGYDRAVDTVSFFRGWLARLASDATGANLAMVKLNPFSSKADLRIAMVAHTDALTQAANATAAHIKEMELDRSAELMKGIRARVSGYKLEASFQADLIALGFKQSDSIKDSAEQIKTKTAALNAEKKEWQSILDIQLSAAEAEQKSMENAWAGRAEVKFNNQQNARWDDDNAAFDTLDAQDALLAETLEMASGIDSVGDAWTRTGDKALDAMGSMLTVMSEVNATEKRYASQQIELDRTRWENESDYINASQALAEAQQKNSVKGSMAMLDASVAMFKEGSEAQKVAHQASLVMHAIEMASQLKLAVATATAGVANQSNGDPYTAFFRVGAMSVMMAGLLSQVGVSFGGVGGGGTPTNVSSLPEPDGTVLGSNDSSESLINVYDMLGDIEADQYAELREINAGMQSLNQNLTGFVSSLYRTGDLSGLGGGYSASYDYATKSWIDGANDQFGDLPILGSITNLFGNIGESLMSGLFGSTKKSVSGYGLNIGDFSLGGDLDLQSYQTIKTKKDGGWFGRSKTSYSTQYADIEGESERLLNTVFDDLRDGMVGFGDLLDRNVTQQVDDFVVSIGNIETSGKTSNEIQEALSAAIGSESDRLAYSIFDDLVDSYAKLNEGAFETISRLGLEKTVVSDILSATNQNMVGDAIALSQSLIEIAGGLDALSSASSAYYDAFFSEQEKNARNQTFLTDALAQQNLVLPSVKEDYRALVESLDLTTDAGQAQYVTLIELSEQAADYYDALNKAQTEALNAQISSVKEGLNSLLTLESSLQDTYDALTFGGSSSALSYATAQSQINDALESARAGSLPELDDINESLNVLRNNTVASYASELDYQRDQAVSANMIGELLGYTDSAISVEEQMLSELQAQTDALNNLSVVSAIDGSHSTGLSSVPFDGYLAETHKGEAIIDARTISGMRKYGIGVAGTNSNDNRVANEIIALRKALNQMSDQLHRGNVAIATSTSDSARLLSKWDKDGQPEVRQ